MDERTFIERTYPCGVLEARDETGSHRGGLPAPSTAEILVSIASVLSSMAHEASEIQAHVSHMTGRARAIDPDALRDLQRLDSHTQYLVEIARLTEGLADLEPLQRVPARDLCRLVRLPSLRARLLDGPSPEHSEAGSVSLF